jgi:hypothetical protein
MPAADERLPALHPDGNPTGCAFYEIDEGDTAEQGGNIEEGGILNAWCIIQPIFKPLQV